MATRRGGGSSFGSIGIAAALFVVLTSFGAGLSSGLARPPASPTAAPTLLASIPHTASGWTIGAYASLSLTFTVSPDSMSPGYTLGEGIRHGTNETGSFDFTPANDSDFDKVHAFLTNGRDDMIYVGTALDGGGAEGASESFRLRRNPDLVTYSVDLIRLVIQSIWIYPEPPGTRYQHVSLWEIYGRPLEVAFVPPTDANGTILINRTYTVVAASLRTSGVARLEWDGLNETMERTGFEWSRNQTGIPAGAHAYRVWTNDSAGNWYATEMRRILVQVGWWRAESIAYGFMPSLTFDGEGVPHLCFANGQGLAYASRRTGAWRVVVLDPRGNTGQQCSIALDAAGHPHISYEDESSYSGISVLMYAHDDGTGWALERVEDVGFTTSTSIAIHPATGEPWIAYYESGGRDLKVAHRSAGTWQTSVVDATGDTGGAPALAFNSSGQPSIAYARFDLRSLRFASAVGGSWRTEIIEPDGVYPFRDAIALRFDSADLPHLAYAFVSGPRYAVRNGTTWDVETIDSEPASGLALRLDSSDRPRIAYLSSYRPHVMYAVKERSWVRELISENATGTGIAMALDRQGIPVVVHPGQEFSNLQYERRVEHAPIRIEGNAGFDEANGLVRGAGTPADPFVLEGWHVDALGGPAVRIRNTTASFVMRDLSIRSGGSLHAGVVLENVTGGTIRETRISDNAQGIRVIGSSDVELTANQISSNGLGVLLEASSGVQLHANRFEGNGQQAADDRGAENVWDLGYPFGGNFWSDYSGLDRCRGPAQDVCPSPDGVGDTSYMIDADSRDRYPLVGPPNALSLPFFTASPSPSFVDVPVRFDASGSVDPDGQIVAYEWDFGDGATGSGVFVSHAYAKEGTFRVTLSVTDDRGMAIETSGTIVIQETPILPLAPFQHPQGFRLPIPVGWDVRQNQVIQGTTVELVLLGPFAQGVQTNIFVDMQVDETVREDAAFVDTAAHETLAEVLADNPSAEIAEAPRLRQIGGHAGFTFAVRHPVESILQKLAVVFSEEHDRYWILLLTTSASRYRGMNATFEAMIAGFEITLSVPRPLGPSLLGGDLFPLVLAGIVGGVAIGVLGVALLVRRRPVGLSRPREAYPSSTPLGPAIPTGPPPVQATSSGSPLPLPGQVAPLPSAARFCPQCGVQTVPVAAFCGRCGTALPK